MKNSVISVLCMVAFFIIVFAGKANKRQRYETDHSETRKGKEDEEHRNHKDCNGGRFKEDKITKSVRRKYMPKEKYVDYKANTHQQDETDYTEIGKSRDDNKHRNHENFNGGRFGEKKKKEREREGEKPREKCINCDVCLSQKCTNVLNTVTITTYMPNIQPTAILADITKISQVIKDLVKDKKKKIAIFIPGLNMESSSDAVRLYFNRYNYADLILFAVDASSLFKGNATKMDTEYIKAAQMTVCLAKAIVKMLLPLLETGIVKAEDISCMGPGFGAHTFGFFGRITNKLFGQKIGYISGLNPVSKCFGRCTGLHLNCDDALIVKCVNTDKSSTSICGAIDFILNGGSNQPVAEQDPMFNNLTIPMLYDALVNYNVKTKQCIGSTKDGKKTARMGYKQGSNTTENEIYYLNTGTATPYCLGSEGII